MIVNEPECQALCTLQEWLGRGLNRIVIQRPAGDSRPYPEYGDVGMMKLRPIDDLVRDYCRSCFDVVLVADHLSMTYADPSMAEKMPDLWPSIKGGRAGYASDDEFAQIANRLGVIEDPLPKSLEEQIFFLCELLDCTSPRTAVLFVDAEHNLGKGLNSNATAALPQLIKTIRNRSHLLCLIVEDVDSLPSLLVNRANFSLMQLPPVSQADFEMVLHRSSVFFHDICQPDAVCDCARLLAENSMGFTEFFTLCGSARRKRVQLLDLLQSTTEAATGQSVSGSFQVMTSTGLTLDDVAGMADVKELIMSELVLPVKHPEIYKKHGKSSGGAALLYGPPGNGKTHFAKSIAGSLRMPFVTATAADLRQKYVGEGEKMVAELFATAARFSNSVLFLDEIEGILGQSDNPSGADLGLRSQVLSELDGIKGRPSGLFVLAATNKPHLLDGSLIRSGRLSPLIYVGPPDEEARHDILRYLLRNAYKDDTMDLADLARRLDSVPSYSGADLAEICSAAKGMAAREEVETGRDVLLSMRHLEKALESHAPCLDLNMQANIDAFRARWERR